MLEISFGDDDAEIISIEKGGNIIITDFYKLNSKRILRTSSRSKKITS